jgi:Mrp family chromosome partitioning ATPase
MNLASALAEGRESVLCIESDIYNPTIGRSVSYDASLGLTECIIDGIDPLSAIVRFEPLRWHFLSAGQKRGDASKVLDADAVGQVLRKLENYFDWIVMDTAPLGPIRDTVGLISQADGALLVVRAEQTPKHLVDESLKLIGRKHALGIVLNAAVEPNATYEDYHGTYYRH